METIPVRELIKLFRHNSFTLQIVESFSETGLVIISLVFPQLTAVPIAGICEGDKELLTIAFCIDINELLRLEQEPYKTPFGWIKGILVPAMRSMLFDSLARGEHEGREHYKKAEYVLEYYFVYATMYPRMEAIEHEDEIYREQKGLQIAEAERIKLLSFFHLQKTRELYSRFGMEVVHWINLIREELKDTNKISDTEALEEERRKIFAIKAKANLLSASLNNKVDMANLPQLKKRD